jgi:hypothetical protein
MNDAGIHRIIGPTILTRSGIYFDFEAPTPAMVCIEDIACALSRICRFTGHGRHFYSVAEHSVLTSYLVDPDHQFAALMHDAAEAYIGDVSRPLKSLMPDYKRIEARVEAVIASAFHLPQPMPNRVKAADMAMLGHERIKVMGAWDFWPGIPDTPLPDTVIRFLDPPDAETLFLNRFHELRALARQAERHPATSIGE